MQFLKVSRSGISSFSVLTIQTCWDPACFSCEGFPPVSCTSEYKRPSRSNSAAFPHSVLRLRYTKYETFLLCTSDKELCVLPSDTPETVRFPLIFHSADHQRLFLALRGKTFSHVSERKFHSLSLGSQRYLKEMTVSDLDCRSIALKNERNAKLCWIYV